MSLPTETPTAFKVRRVEEKKTLPPRDGKPAKIILKLGLEHNGEKAWAELFSDIDPQTWPKEDSEETLILTQPENPEWALKARRPSKGGGGFRGGGKDPAQTKRIERMHAQEMAIRALTAMGAFADGPLHAERPTPRALIKDWTDWFVEDTGQ